MSIKKKHIIGMAGTVIAAVGLVGILAWVAVKPTLQKNGFNRVFNKGLIKLNVIDKPEDVIDICGSTEYNLFFKTKIPSKIWITNYQFENGRYLTLDMPSDRRIISAFYSFVDSPYISLLAGNVPAILTGRLNEKLSINKFPDKIFTRAVIISPDSYVFRGFDSVVKTRDQIFYKGGVNNGIIKREATILARYNDAGISTDGMLNYDPRTHLLTYVNYYSNQFLCLDTNLNTVLKGHTIDTISTLQAITGGIVHKESATYTNIGPKRVINVVSCVENGRLFNHSSLKADNEANKEFNYNSTIDIYDLKHNQYLTSIYVPRYDEETLQQFKVINDTIIVFYKSYIISYRLNFEVNR